MRRARIWCYTVHTIIIIIIMLCWEKVEDRYHMLRISYIIIGQRAYVAYILHHAIMDAKQDDVRHMWSPHIQHVYTRDICICTYRMHEDMRIHDTWYMSDIYASYYVVLHDITPHNKSTKYAANDYTLYISLCHYSEAIFIQ